MPMLRLVIMHHTSPHRLSLVNPVQNKLRLLDCCVYGTNLCRIWLVRIQLGQFSSTQSSCSKKDCALSFFSHWDPALEFAGRGRSDDYTQTEGADHQPKALEVLGPGTHQRPLAWLTPTGPGSRILFLIDHVSSNETASFRLTCHKIN
jgi:hypothetical protein